MSKFFHLFKSCSKSWKWNRKENYSKLYVMKKTYFFCFIRERLNSINILRKMYSKTCRKMNNIEDIACKKLFQLPFWESNFILTFCLSQNIILFFLFCECEKRYEWPILLFFGRIIRISYYFHPSCFEFDKEDIEKAND